MSPVLRIVLITLSALALVMVIRSVIKSNMHIRYSIVWIIVGLILLLMAIFPNIIYFLAHAAGIEVPANAVFLITIGLLYILQFYSYLTLSKQNKEIRDLNYEIAEIKKKLEDNKNVR